MPRYTLFHLFFSNFITKKLSSPLATWEKVAFTIGNFYSKFPSWLTTLRRHKMKNFLTLLTISIASATAAWFSHKQCFLPQNTCQAYTLLRTLCSHDYSFHFGYNNHNVTEIPFGNEVWIQTYVDWLGEFKLSESLFNRVISPIQFTLNHPLSFPIFL